MYVRQRSRVHADEQDRFEKRREADADGDFQCLETATNALELAKSASSLLETPSPIESRGFLERRVRNLRLDQRALRYDFKKPFDVLAKMLGVEIVASPTGFEPVLQP